ncbi:MAG: hypothetical protein GY795_42435, partial [Desulfobacterales bacterium]|nr:hypothetical protein [Desulfobacterales bacterium]
SISDMKSPNSKKETQRFIGAVGFLRDHIPDLTELLTPLRRATNITPFKWDSDCERCFLKVKELITTPNALVCFDPQCETIVTTDASDIGMGGAISQIINGQEKIIAYWSKTFTKTEQNYPVVIQASPSRASLHSPDRSNFPEIHLLQPDLRQRNAMRQTLDVTVRTILIYG